MPCCGNYGDVPSTKRQSRHGPLHSQQDPQRTLSARPESGRLAGGRSTPPAPWRERERERGGVGNFHG